MRVAIEVGHGGHDVGAIGENNRFEKDDNLKFALLLKQMFLSEGLDVLITREQDVFISTYEKCKKEHSPKCDIAIACHRNGFSNPQANGFEIWISSDADSSVERWADDICKSVAKTGMTIRSGGVFKGFRGNSSQDYYWNRDTKSPSMLIELGFITNKNDNKLFDNNIEYYAMYVVEASLKYLSQKTVSKIYRVQIGAFNSKSNAEKYLEKAKSVGFFGVIV